ncbi:1,2-dihydroxy-3-keto-5-methylthiopentene dioxygenase [Gonapodya prolifera JEL478]|uniref:Acireductone dioxygenase n=1 Tax=Gonapodya prolifera (strain JEL478) TaxID=1344416 RepID=A0A139AJL9_GONPJ|nr:1,2-dihydroxy-3-keto-5-methylthiopentene dioxygenase [Gonapodya prolifera JEL478]|eukprot:KXS16744.1 1,2-dihydroxy-3-keto-5-methylthiopentene dioxygenase [Gonapodya prolifera JEL478]
MVAAWAYDESAPGDQRAPHQHTPNRPVSLDYLAKFGVLYYYFPHQEDGSHLEKIEALCRERDYKNRDSLTISKEKMGDVYDSKLKMFFQEHIHEDEEIRYCLDGSGYFDVRDPQDKWIRVAWTKGDCIILPAGIYHRFTLDESNYAQAMRLFKDDPKWTPINRPGADENSYRKEYVEKISKLPVVVAST